MAGDPRRELDEFQLPRPWLAWLETMALSGVVVTIGYFVDHKDPWFTRAAFSWAALAPLLAGVRYGFAYGFGSAFAIILTLAANWRWQWVTLEHFPAQYSLGLLGVGMLAGEFNDMWTRRLQQMSLINDYRRMRLDQFTRAYHILKVSHDRLEQRYAGSTQSLREALTTLRRDLLAAKRRAPHEPFFGLADRVINLFASYGWVQVAALYAVDEHGNVASAPAAELGQGATVAPNDPLIAEALRTGELAAIRSDEAGAVTPLVLAIPIVDVNQRIWAIVTVRAIHFIALHGDNLRLIAVMSGHIGDILTAGPALPAGDTATLPELMQHLARSIDDLKRHGLPSAIVSVVCRGEKGAAVASLVLSLRRGLDQAYSTTNRRGETVLLLLLPLTDQHGVQGYLARLGQVLSREQGEPLAELPVTLQSRLVERGDTADRVLRTLQEQCEIE